MYVAKENVSYIRKKIYRILNNIKNNFTQATLMGGYML